MQPESPRARAKLHAVLRTAARYEDAIAPRLESTEYTKHVLRRAWDRGADRAPGRCRAGGGLAWR